MVVQKTSARRYFPVRIEQATIAFKICLDKDISKPLSSNYDAKTTLSTQKYPLSSCVLNVSVGFFGGEIEIIPWKVRTNVFYSQVAHRNASWIKPLKHFPWYDVFILYTLRFFSRPTHFKVWKPFKVIPLKWNLPWDFSQTLSNDCCSWLQSVGMIEKAGRRQVRSGVYLAGSLPLRNIKQL